jgi:preprotein translocase subunit SecA
MATAELAQRGLDPVETPDEFNAAWQAAVAKAEVAVAAERDEVRGVGGLYVVATERHESRRIDNQLRGRSGRQGDPGESRFYLSLEDDLLRLFNAGAIDSFLVRFNVPDDVPIEAKLVTNAIRSAQTQVESQNFEIRKNVLKYDEVLNRQRLVIYSERRKVLEGEDLHDQVAGFIEDVVSAYALAATADGFAEEWDLDTLWQAFAGVYNIQLTIDDVVEESGGPRESLSGEVIEAIIKEDVQKAYAAREAELGEDVLRELERRVVLSVLDQKWREHLYEMDYLQEGIGLRALAQRDPVVEYQREGYDLFVAMMDAIKEESASLVFNVDVEVEATPDEGPEIITPGLAEPRRPAALQYTAPDIDAAGGLSQSVATTGPIIDPEFGEVSKNALCPCGSGRKYKRCHGDPKQRA